VVFPIEISIKLSVMKEYFDNNLAWIVPLGAIIIGLVVFVLWTKTNKYDKEKDPNGIHWRVAVYAALSFIFLMFLIATLLGLLGLREPYLNFAVTIIISWIVILLAYYAWALYFYNVNYGWSEEDWKRFRKEKQSNPEVMEEEPLENPHKEETLGLPPGTVRGTIALTLLVGALSLSIAALSFDDRIRENELLIDHFDFLKQAFLMMIAFYFGTKSLEILQGDHPKTENATKVTDTNQPAAYENVLSDLPQPIQKEQSGVSQATALKKALQQEDVVAEAAMQSDFYDPKAVS
jgi:Ca2+/Na+ antiporter